MNYLHHTSTLLLIYIVDTTPPSIDYCPDNIKETVETGVTTTSVSWKEPRATDLSGNVMQSVKSRVPTSFSTFRDTQVMFIFVDDSGNEAVCEFFVSFTFGKSDVLLNLLTFSGSTTFILVLLSKGVQVVISIQ